MNTNKTNNVDSTACAAMGHFIAAQQRPRGIFDPALYPDTWEYFHMLLCLYPIMQQASKWIKSENPQMDMMLTLMKELPEYVEKLNDENETTYFQHKIELSKMTQGFLYANIENPDIEIFDFIRQHRDKSLVQRNDILSYIILDSGLETKEPYGEAGGFMVLKKSEPFVKTSVMSGGKQINFEANGEITESDVLKKAKDYYDQKKIKTAFNDGILTAFAGQKEESVFVTVMSGYKNNVILFSHDSWSPKG